jgi:hypothetical protein
LYEITKFSILLKTEKFGGEIFLADTDNKMLTGIGLPPFGVRHEYWTQVFGDTLVKVTIGTV